MEIMIKRGDILKLAKEEYILHQVNEDGVMGGGLALQIANKYPEVEKQYKEYVSNHAKEELYGTYQIVKVDKNRYVVNCFTQKNYNTDYDALNKVLTDLKKEIGKKIVAMPYMYGCGIANGVWGKVYDIIKEVIGEDVILYNYNNKITMYKATDKNMSCRNLQYNLNDIFEQNEELELCGKGFHACRNFKDIKNYYDILESEIYEVEMLGDVIDGSDKSSTNKIRFIRQIINEELEGLKNSGKNNTGLFNTGNSNTGNSNTGDWNTGNSNTGNWNRTNYETGCFNTIQSDYVNIFNKPCKIKIWENCNKPSFLYFKLTKWIYEKAMNDQEKQDNPTYKTTGGYLKLYKYKEAFQNSYNDLSEYKRKKETETLKNLPNFDADVFYKISGIRIEEE